jgi:hypothetical protein
MVVVVVVMSILKMRDPTGDARKGNVRVEKRQRLRCGVKSVYMGRKFKPSCKATPSLVLVGALNGLI